MGTPRRVRRRGVPENVKKCQEVHAALDEQPGEKELFRTCFTEGWVDGETSTEKAMITTPTEELSTSLQCQLLPPHCPDGLQVSTSRLSGYARSASGSDAFGS